VGPSSIRQSLQCQRELRDKTVEDQRAILAKWVPNGSSCIDAPRISPSAFISVLLSSRGFFTARLRGWPHELVTALAFLPDLEARLEE
jgi:hypothetical protein